MKDLTKLNPVVNVGLGNFILTDKVIGVYTYGSRTASAMRRKAKELDRHMDVTGNRRSKSVICLTDGHVVSSPLSPSTIVGRMGAAPVSGSDD
jgi:regulator of extracellular matrix RemA (YlzA/DUF370 family)